MRLTDDSLATLEALGLSQLAEAFAYNAQQLDTVTQDLSRFKMLSYYRDQAKTLVKSISRQLSGQDPTLKQYKTYKDLGVVAKEA
jgi:hypothetical protein